ncbi:hypothetical protein ACVMFA_005252 [Bradyrhizobium liaoningense]
MAVQGPIAETVDVQLDRLAGPHMCELGLLEVGKDIDRIERHHSHQLRAGLHVLADAQAAGADRAIHRRGDLGIGQVQRRLLRDRTGTFELGCGLGALAGEHVDLALRSQKAVLRVLQLRAAGAQRRVGLLRALDRAGARLHEVVVAGALLLCEFQVGVRSSDVSRALLDDRLLQLELGIDVAHGGFGSRDVGAGLIERRPEIAVVDLGQQLACLDLLVVTDQHLGDVAGHFRRDDRGIGLHIGVVSGFEVPAGLQIVVAIVAGHRDAEDQRQADGRPIDCPSRQP